MRPELDSGQ